jgi:hypothetical protein
MTFESTLDLLYLIISIAVLWVAAMLTWVLFEVGLAMRNTNRIIKSVQQKVLWIESMINGIGEKLESSTAYLGTIAKGGKMIAEFMKNKKESWDEDEWEEEDDEEEEEPPKRKRRTTTKSRKRTR